MLPAVGLEKLGETQSSWPGADQENCGADGWFDAVHAVYGA